jgi:hypothetical protein
MKNVTHWLKQLAIALDQLANVLLAPCSLETWADETISSRCGRMGHRYPYKVYKAVIDALFYWREPDHCDASYRSELSRYQLPPSMRTGAAQSNSKCVSCGKLDVTIAEDR